MDGALASPASVLPAAAAAADDDDDAVDSVFINERPLSR